MFYSLGLLTPQTEVMHLDNNNNINDNMFLGCWKGWTSGFNQLQNLSISCSITLDKEKFGNVFLIRKLSHTYRWKAGTFLQRKRVLEHRMCWSKNNHDNNSRCRRKLWCDSYCSWPPLLTRGSVCLHCTVNTFLQAEVRLSHACRWTDSTSDLLLLNLRTCCRPLAALSLTTG